MSIDRPKLYRAQWPAVMRLARALGLATPPGGCGCVVCREKLTERIVRRL